MLKKIARILIAAVAVGYALFAFAIIPSFSKEGKCKGVLVEITGNSHEAMSREEIIEILTGEKLDPSGKGMKDFQCKEIENCIGNISMVKECQVYKSIGDYVKIEINCRKPIMKVFGNDGESYCIDSEGNIIEGIQRALFLPVASGNIDRESVSGDVTKVANAINGSRFWSALIEQIYLNEKGEFILIPRVGNHTIELGTADNVDTKLQKLHTFYTEAMGTVGWNKYSKINIEFNDKIVCTKREKK